MPASFVNQPVTDPTINANNNRINATGYTFDSAGNMTVDAGGQNYTYDAENKQTQVTNGSGTLGQYWYDGDGKRVKKYVPGTGETTVFVYDAAGKQIAEYSTIVAGASTAKVNYLTDDHLGSPRINTDQNGAVIARHDYHPFGEEVDGTGGRTMGLNYGDDSVRKEFTGYERDNEIDLDFAQARYYAVTIGRFSSADPLYFTENRLTDPQTQNLYVYVRNSPLIAVDPSGLDVKVKDKTKDRKGAGELLAKLNGNPNAKFSLGYDKKGKLQIVDSKGNAIKGDDLKKLGKSLSGGNKALFNAVTDKNNHATITVVRGDANVDFGSFQGNGNNTVDIQDMSLLDSSSNAGGLSAVNAISHEIVEAYTSAVNPNLSESAAHQIANNAFGGLMRPANGMGVWGQDPATGEFVNYGELSPIYGRTDGAGEDSVGIGNSDADAAQTNPPGEYNLRRSVHA